MEKEFIPHDLALELKELGFDEPSLAYYSLVGELRPIDTDFVNVRGLSEECVSAPTWRSAFKWIREKYKLHSFVDIYPRPDEPERCWYMIRYLERGEEGKEDYMSGWFENQEEIEPACLKQLIKMVKEK